MKTEKLNLTIEELTSHGIINRMRCYEYFKKHNLLTAKAICEMHERYKGNWSHMGEKGTPVSACAKQVYDYTIHDISIEKNTGIGEVRYQTIEPFLSKRLRLNRGMFINALSNENIYEVWHDLIKLYFDLKHEQILLQHRLLIIDPKFKPYDELGVNVNAITVNLNRLHNKKRIPEFVRILSKAQLICNENFKIQQRGHIIQVVPSEIEKYNLAGMGLSFLYHVIPILKPDYLSINEIINKPTKDLQLINETAVFFNARDIDLNYLNGIFARIRDAFYSKRYGVNINCDINKQKENHIIYDIMNYALRDYKPTFDSDNNSYYLSFAKIPPSLSSAILEIFIKNSGTATGEDAFKANNHDIQTIIKNSPEYSHLTERSDVQIKEAMYSNKMIQSVNQSDSSYRLISALKFGPQSSDSIVFHILNLPEYRKGLTLEDLYELIAEGGYGWTMKTIDIILRQGTAYYILENSKWFSIENKFD